MGLGLIVCPSLCLEIAAYSEDATPSLKQFNVESV
jgi:hypothetical protein